MGPKRREGKFEGEASLTMEEEVYGNLISPQLFVDNASTSPRPSYFNETSEIDYLSRGGSGFREEHGYQHLACLPQE